MNDFWNERYGTKEYAYSLWLSYWPKGFSPLTNELWPILCPWLLLGWLLLWPAQAWTDVVGGDLRERRCRFDFRQGVAELAAQL